MQGERFTVDLDEPRVVQAPNSVFSRVLRDIHERPGSSGGRCPSPPRLKAQHGGFPRHRDRVPTYKAKLASRGQAPTLNPNSDGLNERTMQDNASAAAYISRASDAVQRGFDDGISSENERRIASMSKDEIEAVQNELRSSLSPAMIATILGRSSTIAPVTAPLSCANLEPTESIVTYSSTNASDNLPQSKDTAQAERAPLKPPQDLHPVASSLPLPSLPDLSAKLDALQRLQGTNQSSPPSKSFSNSDGSQTQICNPPELDPTSPTFLQSLHETFYPSLPQDPTSLAWMQPIAESEKEAYSPTATSLPPSSLRFDFRGHLLPPRLSAQIPTTKGLHHHGLAPDKAGYTLSELFILARSTVAAQKCIAYQTLGRILYRLGRADFGRPGDDLYEALWDMLEKSAVLQLMLADAAGDANNAGHRTTWAVATDALWLWKKAGGRKRMGR